MRIAFLVNEFPEISETFILDQIIGLIERGCEIDIFFQHLSARNIAHPEVAMHSLMDRSFQLSPPPESSKLIRLGRALRDVAFAFPKHPTVVVHTISLNGFGANGHTLKRFYRLLPFLARGPYDVVHCHFGPNGLIGAELRNLGAFHAPLLTQFHGYDISSYVKHKGEDIYEDLFSCGELFLCVSNRIRERVIQLGCDPRKARVHHTGVKVRSIPFRSREFDPDGGIRLLSVGRLVEKKGIEFGLRAVANLISEYPKLEYTIVGEGPLLSDLSKLARELLIESHVRFVGAQTRDAVSILMRDSDILLAPSMLAGNGDAEGIPVVLMEALAYGLPVVSTFHSGIPELISHGISGLLSPERSPEAQADHVRFLINHPNERLSMAIAGRRAVEQGFDVDELNAQLVVIYEEEIATMNRKRILDGTFDAGRGRSA